MTASDRAIVAQEIASFPRMRESSTAGVTLRRDHAARRELAWRSLRFVLAALLLTAALLKTHGLATAPGVGSGIFASHWFALAVVQVELLVAIWLIVGLWAAWAWRATLGLFAIFGVVSLFKALAGEASCGCFGRVAVNPWITTAINVAAIAALGAFRPRGSAPRVSMQAVALPLTAWLALGTIAGIAAVSYRPSNLDESGQISGSGVVMLEPETWFGQRLPLLAHIDIGPELEHGDWLLVLYRSNCPKCHVLFSRLNEVPSNARQQAGAPKLACVEIPGRSSNAPPNDPKLPHCLHGTLAADYDWFVETPVVFHLRNGRVESVSAGSRVSLDLAADLHAGRENAP
jgi:hypothetical protein